MEQVILPTGDKYYRDERAIIIRLEGARRIMSTSAFNGGCREDLAYLFNFCEVYGKEDERCEMRAATYKEHLRMLTEELGLDPQKTTGLSTAAKMKYARLNTEKYDDFTVTAIVTGSVDDNGSRPGDPAFWHEKEGVPCPVKPGTVNIMVFIDACLPEGSLARALVMITEAKTAALQEVLAPSCYSQGLATGSGTDGIIVASNLESSTCLTDAGQHSKLGEHLGRVVKKTVREAVSAEEGFEAYACSSMLRRIRRYGINEESLWELYCSPGQPGALDRDSFRQRLEVLDRDGDLIALATVYAHVLDLLEWKLTGTEQAERLAEDLLKGRSLAKAVKENLQGAITEKQNREIKNPEESGSEAAVKALVNRFSRHLISLVVRK
ncbi:MAG: adenosylcobinamide amidohydrolase [Bacillota bacterium]